MMKSDRHEKILALIRSRPVETQEELQALLRVDGFPVTQATVSRDIRELRLIKVQAVGGGYRYATPGQGPDIAYTKLRSLFSDAVQTVDHAGNIVVARCLSGMAQAACAALDSLRWENAVGSLAGEDTFIVIARNEADAAKMAEELKRLTVDM